MISVECAGPVSYAFISINAVGRLMEFYFFFFFERIREHYVILLLRKLLRAMFSRNTFNSEPPRESDS